MSARLSPRTNLAWRNSFMTSTDQAISNCSEDSFSDTSSDEIDKEFEKRREAQNDPEKIRKEYTFTPRRKQIKITRQIQHSKKSQARKKQVTQMNLSVTGHNLVAEGVSHVQPPVFEHYQQQIVQNSTLPVDWLSLSSKKRVTQRPNTVLEALHKPKPLISSYQIDQTSRELKQIQTERARQFSAQKTPDWAKGVNSMLAPAARRRRQTGVISKTMKGVDFLI